MFCDLAKEFLSKNKIEFHERNIVSDPEALGQLRELHVMTTPVTMVGETVIVGFDEERLRRELGIDEP